MKLYYLFRRQVSCGLYELIEDKDFVLRFKLILLHLSVASKYFNNMSFEFQLTIDEYSTRVGQQAVVLVATPSKSGNNFKCFGAKPLEDVVSCFKFWCY